MSAMHEPLPEPVGDAAAPAVPASREDRHAPTRARLDDWRERGAERLDPAGFARIEALLRRASAHQGTVGRVLDARLDALIEAFAAAFDARQAHVQEAADAIGQTPPPRTAAPSPFATLALDRTHTARSGPPPELLDYFREIWSRLSADQQVQQSLDIVPKNAGPLNSSSLVHRALLLMRELSPEYLRQFLSYADALSWLEDIQADPAAATAKEAPRSAPAKKARRTRAR
ncbi:DUF2894 domain-containing protein [Burkholderia gladioli]|nr:DUF2894 domain-containing protein [Burkholderia gladioli]MCH7274520.1 DUF2894 domain-containing protein [Burkholderia gladioli]MDZ4039452.1 DUF2894 domain-containing protein [Burkholderia gladioli pv. alliicola]MEB2549249.1 DUF2894 domain-containing protein [Burkholderia gladioli]